MTRILLCVALLLGGCSTLSTVNTAANTPVTQAQADTALNTVLALKATWIASEKVAIAYAKRPICGPATTAPLCSDPKLVQQFGAAAPAVSSSINAAESAARTVGTSTSVLNAAILAAQTVYQSYVAVMSAAGIK